MIALAKRVLVPRLWISLVLAAILSVGLASSHGNTRSAKAQQVERAAVVIGYFDATSHGNMGGALAAFAGNAVFSANGPADPCYRPTPCSDSAGISQQVLHNVEIHVCQIVLELNVVGAVVTGRVETRADSIRVNGVPRILGSFLALVPQDKITFLAVVGDVADPQTALNVAVNAGTQPTGTPIPNPSTPCGQS